MPAPRTNNHEPKKVYFSAKEARLYLDCGKEWLNFWALKMGFKSRPDGTWHRYTAEEINKLSEIRKFDRRVRKYKR